jgi:hypothetical protein
VWVAFLFNKGRGLQYNVPGGPHAIWFVGAQDSVDQHTVADVSLERLDQLVDGGDVAVLLPGQCVEVKVHLDALGGEQCRHLARVVTHVENASIHEQLYHLGLVLGGGAGVAEVGVDANTVSKHLGRLSLLDDSRNVTEAAAYDENAHQQPRGKAHHPPRWVHASGIVCGSSAQLNWRTCGSWLGKIGGPTAAIGGTSKSFAA